MFTEQHSKVHLSTTASSQRWWLKCLLFAVSALLVAQFVVSQCLIFPFDAPDERVHFARAHDVAFAPGVVKTSSANGRVAVGAFFYDPQPIHDCYGKPDCLNNSAKSQLSLVRLNQFFGSSFKVGYAGSDNSFPYSGGNYLHLIPSLLLSAQFHLSVLSAYLNARFSSGLVFLLVSALLIASIRSQLASGANAFFVALLGLGFWLPSSVFLSNSVSGDFLVTVAAVLIGLFLLSSSWRLSSHLTNLFLCAQPLLYLIVLGKLPYAPLVLAAIVLTWLRFKDARRAWFLVLSFASFVVPSWWYVQSRSAVLTLFRAQRGAWVGEKLSPAQLFEWVQGSSFSLVSQFGDLCRQLVAVFGNGPVARIFLPEWFHAVHGILLIIVILSLFAAVIRVCPFEGLSSKSLLPLSLHVGIPILAVVATYFMICYGLRLYWSNTYPLDGLQGRYFLPLLPFIVVAPEAWFSSLPVNGWGQFSPDQRMHLDQKLLSLSSVVLLLSVLQLIFYIKNILHFYTVPMS